MKRVINPKKDGSKVEDSHNLKDLRLAAGYSQDRICKLVGVSQTCYSFWERGFVQGSGLQGDNNLKLKQIISIFKRRIKYLKDRKGG